MEIPFNFQPELPNRLLQIGQKKVAQLALIDDVARILDKIARSEPLGRSDLSTEVTPTEVAAIWSIKNKTGIQPTYVRQVKRAGRIEPSREWGKGPAYRCLYKVLEVIDIKVGHERGWPKKQVAQA